MYLLSRHLTACVLLVLLSIALVVFQHSLGGELVTLWCHWATAGLCAWGVHSLVRRLRLVTMSTSRAFFITWPLLTLALCFAAAHPEEGRPWWTINAILLAFTLLQNMLLGMWQQTHVTPGCLMSGAIIGLTSLLDPRALLWLPLSFIGLYMLRSWSPRNFWSLPTGALLGVWMCWSSVYLFVDRGMAIDLLYNYASLWSFDLGLPTQPLGLWEIVLLALINLSALVFALISLAYISRQGIRARDGVGYLVFLTLSVLLLCRMSDAMELPMLLLCLHLSIQQTSVRSVLGEWSLLLFIAACVALYLR